MDNPQNANLGPETLTSAPPAPQEVKVRTMRSDLASMAQSGGGLPQYQNVRIARSAHGTASQPGASNNSSLVSLVVAMVAVLILLIAGYFGYIAVRNHDAAETRPTTGTTGSMGQ